MKSFDEYWYAPEHVELRKLCAMGWAMRVWNASRDATLSDPVAYAVFANNGNIRIWCADPTQVETLRQQYGDALQPLYTAPQPAEQQPIRHDWDDQDKCRRCGDRDWYASATCTPKQQPAPDVSALVEALECMIIGACAVAVPHNGERAVLQDAVSIARAALAAHRKGGEE